MQSYNINLKNGASYMINAAARRFVYESGQTLPEGADSRIVVKPDTGNEIVLRPGQSFALEPGVLASGWNIRAFDSAVLIVGSVIIGSGEFEDNSLKVDAGSGAIQTLQLNPDPTIAYTHCREVRTNGSGTLGEQVFVTAAENVNGVVIINVTATNAVSGIDIIAALPAQGTYDIGRDVLAWELDKTLFTLPWRMVRVPPGKRVAAVLRGSNPALVMNMLVKIL